MALNVIQQAQNNVLFFGREGLTNPIKQTATTLRKNPEPISPFIPQRDDGHRLLFIRNISDRYGSGIHLKQGSQQLAEGLSKISDTIQASTLNKLARPVLSKVYGVIAAQTKKPQDKAFPGKEETFLATFNKRNSDNTRAVELKVMNPNLEVSAENTTGLETIRDLNDCSFDPNASSISVPVVYFKPDMNLDQMRNLISNHIEKLIQLESSNDGTLRRAA